MKTPAVAIASLFIASSCSKKDPAPSPAPTVAPATQPAPSPEPEPAPDAAQAATPDATAPNPEPEATPDANAAPEPDAAAAADPAGGDPAGGTRPADAVPVDKMPSFYASLFGTEPFVFLWAYQVDTHSVDEKDAVATLEATLTCKSEVSTMAEARLADFKCTLSKKKGKLEIDHALDRVWIATTDGLWNGGTSLPADPAALAEILKNKPFLPASPVAFVDKRAGDPDNDIPESATSVANEDDGTWCRTDESEAMYGTASDTWCFAPERGLVSVEIQLRSGPSTETYKRQ